MRDVFSHDLEDMMVHEGSDQRIQEGEEEGGACQSLKNDSVFVRAELSALPCALSPPLLINSGFVHLLCCMFVSSAKERSVQAPDTCIYTVYISKHTQIF